MGWLVRVRADLGFSVQRCPQIFGGSSNSIRRHVHTAKGEDISPLNERVIFPPTDGVRPECVNELTTQGLTMHLAFGVR